MKILWVEDEHIRLSGLIRPLRRQGAEIVTADCAKAGVEAFKNFGPFDLCIVDLIMPFSNDQGFGKAELIESHFEESNMLYAGLYVVKEIRALDTKIPILVLTVVYDHEVRSIIRAMNAEVIQKGAVLPSDLSEMIKSKMEL